ncbi:ABC transporter permease [Candidatus Woesearchaeota archaeon]|nr:ABC transporter permease [Candidatus Woesearchaeota archaeon]
MNPVLILAKNNLRMLFRSRTTAIAIITIPLLLLFFAGLLFDTTSVYRVRVGAWSPAYTDVSNAVLSTLQESQFKVEQYEREEDCVDAVRLGDQHACLVFPAGFALGGENNKLTFYLDPSRATLVNVVLGTIEPRIESYTQDVSKNLTRAIMDALSTVRNSVSVRKGTVVTLTTTVNNAGFGISQVLGTLGAPEAALDINQLGIQDVLGRGAGLSEVAERLANDSLIIADALKSQLQALDGYVNSSGMTSSEKSVAKAGIANATSAADDLRTAANLSKNDVAANNLTGTVQVLLDRLDAAKQTLGALVDARNASLVNLQGVKGKLDSSLVSIAEIQKGLDEMHQAITGLAVVDPEAVVTPIRTVITPVSAESSYLNYAFPFLMMLVLLFSGLLLPCILMLSERNSPARTRALLVPLSDVSRMAGVLVSCVAVLAVQALLMLVVAAFFFPIWLGLPVLVPALLAISMLFVLIGMLIGSLVTQEFNAILAGVLVGAALLLASGFIVPLDVLPRWLSVIAGVNPVVIGGEVVRIALLFNGVGFGWNVLDILVLLVWAVALACAVVWVSRNDRRLTLERAIQSVMALRKK